MHHVDDVLRTISARTAPRATLPAPKELPLVLKPMSMFFVDGGHGELLPGNACSVVLITMCGLLYEKKLRKRLREQYYCVLSLSDTCVYIQTFPTSRWDGKTLQGDIPAVSNLLRRLLELSFAIQHASLASVICLDGSFDTGSAEEEVSLSELKRLTPCIGLSKTCSLTFNGSYVTVLAAQQFHAKQPSYMTWKNIHLAKLHPCAQHVFRADVHGDPLQLLGGLANYSSDPSFFGYPYPLILADKYAKVTQQDIAAQQALFASRAGMSWQSLKKAMTGMNAHAIIDKINKNS